MRTYRVSLTRYVGDVATDERKTLTVRAKSKEAASVNALAISRDAGSPWRVDTANHVPRPKTQSRQDRWAEAAGEIESALSTLEAAIDSLREIQEEFQEWLDGLPEGGSAETREKLEAVCDLELGSVEDADLSELAGVGELELPLGFGRD